MIKHISFKRILLFLLICSLITLISIFCKNQYYEYKYSKIIDGSKKINQAFWPKERIISETTPLNQPKVAFITAIYGGYETSCKPFVQQTVPTDFICFTDDRTIIDNGWEIDYTPYHLANKSYLDTGDFKNSISNNKHKFNIAKYYKQAFYNIPRLEKYDIIVWLDGSLEITDPNLTKWIISKIKNKEESLHGMIIWEHDEREGILLNEVIASNFDRYYSKSYRHQKQPIQNVQSAYDAYLQDGYRDNLWKEIAPEEAKRKNFGVWITCLIAFDNRDPKIKIFLDLWYLETLTKITQDQVTFSYAAQKMKIWPYTLPDKEILGNVSKNQHFYKHVHGK